MAPEVDARAALTTLHVRPVSFEARAALGDDVVVFVGGPGDRRTAGALALPPAGPAWALLPIAKDIGSFGWPSCAWTTPCTSTSRWSGRCTPTGSIRRRWPRLVDGRKTWVARVRAAGRRARLDPRCSRSGQITAEGAFAPRDVLASAAKLTDVVARRRSARRLWVAWVDGSGSWLERVVCR